MIEEWTLSSFKAVAERTTLELAPLTLLVGPNSSGKSTILQSMLMMAQTLSSPTSDRPLVLNGELVRLGYFNDALHAGGDTTDLEIGCTLAGRESADGQPSSEAIRLLARFCSERERQGAPSLLRLRHLDLSWGQSARIQTRTAHDGMSDLSQRAMETTRLHDPTLGSDIERGRFCHRIFVLQSTERGETFQESMPPVRASLRHFLPDKLLQPIDVRRQAVILTLRETASALVADKASQVSVSPLEFGSPVGKPIREALRENLRTVEQGAGSGRPIQEVNIAYQRLLRGDTLQAWLDHARLQLSTPMRKRIADQFMQDAGRRELQLLRLPPSAEHAGYREIDLPPTLAAAVGALRDQFVHQLKYLGPLRDDPRAIYGFPTSPDSRDVGLKGENTASVLERNKDLSVRYPGVPTSEDPLPPPTTGTLIEAITTWLCHMGLVDTVGTRDRGKFGYELTVRTSGVSKSFDLTNVGVGVSQVLPTLTLALIAPRGSTLLLEQPELHLHPRVQSILTDFFLGMARLGTQCIVETHSEHMVNRARLRIAQAEGSSLQELTAIHFAELIGGAARFRRVQPNQYGAIHDWPKGFFDEGAIQAQKIMEAAILKRRRS